MSSPSDPALPSAAAVAPRGPARRPLAVWLGGRIALDDYWPLAERLAWEVSEPAGRGPTLLVCEPGAGITIGREGSRADVAFSDDELRSRRITVRFVGRGGGAVLHAPGQVFAAVFARLDDLGLSRHDVGGHLERFGRALEGTLRQVKCGPARVPGLPGVGGRSGLLAAVGVAVRRGVACHGAFVNVCPALDDFQRVRTVDPAAAWGPGTMGSIEADVRRKVRLQDVRTALVQQVVEAYAFPRAHIHAGLPGTPGTAVHHQPEAVRRVG
jgi:lipoyl(octanoyl) transferase